MEMLDRYLAEVQRNLPRDREPDIIDEIGDDIRSQIEEREAALARPLTADEEAEILRAYGNPKLVAARYAKQQYLIGPQLLPFYWYALRLALIVVLGLEVVGGTIAGLATKSVSPFFTSLDAAFHSIIYIFGIVTAVFAAIERSGSGPILQKLERWDPRKLPNAQTGAPVSRGRTGIEFIANVTMLLVTIEVWRGPFQAFIAPLVLTDTWRPLYLALIAASSIVALAALAVYIRPALGKAQLAARSIGHIIVITGIGLALRGGTLVIAQPNTVAPDKLAAANMMLTVSFIIVIACVTIAAAVDLWKLIRVTQTMSSASA